MDWATDALVTWIPLGADVAVKATVALVLAFAVTAALRRAAPAARHVVWVVVLAALLVLPLALASVSWRLPVLPVPAAATEAAPDRAVTGSPWAASPGGRLPAAAGAVAPDAAEPAGARPVAVAEARPVSGGGIQLPEVVGPAGVVLLLWLAGAVVLLARLGASVVAARRLVRSAEPVEDRKWSAQLRWMALRVGVRSPVRLLRSGRVPVPVTCGLVRPAIVLPPGSDAWSEDRRRAVLLHELAHIRRRDLLTQLVAQAARAVYWFHPLAWGAVRRLRQESERAADDVVLAAGAHASAYADHLLQIVRTARRVLAPAASLPMAQRSDFEGRLLAILEPRRRRTPGAARLVLLGAFTLLLMVPLAAAAPAPAAPTEAPQVTRTPQLSDAALADSRPVPADEAAASSGAVEEGGSTAAAGASVVASPRSEPGEDDTEAAAVPVAGARTASGETVTRALIGVLGDRESEVRRSAVRALAERQDTAAVAALGQALRTDPDAEVRRTAAWALGELEDRRAVPALGDGLRDEAEEVRRMSAWALGEIEHPDAVPMLMAAADDASEEVREMAVWALGEIEHPDAVPVLARFVDDSSAAVRAKAVWALGEIESPDALPALERALSDGSADVREKAAWSIGEIQPSRMPAALLDAMTDASAGVRRMAAWAAGEIEDPAATDGLTALLQDESREVARTALWALSEIGEGPAMDALLELLQSDDPEIRRAAAEALGRRRDR